MKRKKSKSGSDDHRHDDDSCTDGILNDDHFLLT